MTDRITRVSFLEEFVQHFRRPVKLFRAPARINIIGEHCDYNDGLVMPVNMALYTWLAIAPRNDRQVHIRASNLDQLAIIELDHIEKTADGGWQEYPKGVLHVLQNNGFDLRGADMLVGTDIPIGGGLSSSASLETVIGMAMLTIAEHNIDRSRLAWMCKEAENDFVGVSCGIMDQYVISLSKRGHAMKLDCRTMNYEQVLPPPDACFLVVNSGVQHSLSDGGFNDRQQECLQAVAVLSNCFPNIKALRDVNPEQLVSQRSKLGDVLFRRARHVISEIQRVRDAHGSMVANDPGQLGRLMNASHASLKDDYEVSCVELDALAAIARSCAGVFGSRMVGAGFGGCTVSLVKNGSVHQVIQEISERYADILGHAPWARVVEAADPVSELDLS